MKFLRILWYVAFITYVGFMIRWYIQDKLDWVLAMPLLFLISTMPFKDFNVFKKKK